MENQEPTKEQLEAYAIRQSKLVVKLQAEVGNLISMNLEQQIIMEDLQTQLTAAQGETAGPAPEVLIPEVVDV